MIFTFLDRSNKGEKKNNKKKVHYSKIETFSMSQTVRAFTRLDKNSLMEEEGNEGILNNIPLFELVYIMR